MEFDMETSSSFLNPEYLSIREQFRRYGKRHSASSISPHQQRAVLKINEPTLLYDGTNIHSPTNTALILENIKQEAQSVDYGGTPVKMQSARSQSLKACKIENDALADSEETTFSLFASLLDSALGLKDHARMYLNQLGECYYALSRYGSNIQLRVVEDKLMRQKAQLLLDEAASWSLLWYLYGKALTVLCLQKLDESLLEDVWTLLRAGRLEEAYTPILAAMESCHVMPRLEEWTYFHLLKPWGRMVLILLSNRRKYVPKNWFNATVWSPYMVADAVATMALGLILNELGDIYKKGGVTGPKRCCSENGLESLEDDFLGDDWFKSIEIIKVLFGDEFVLWQPYRGIS
ncbi:hypothetical protein Pint_29226 [Pistacia integerrima]|uniref:Uncharacterized protein n=1 Tax=Pistacia integerrima TaxID=434235 RepID=A0ACC0X217_9ROSI|nr:hypothetical protein Pint_29226 [Pistacia integerrima]